MNKLLFIFFILLSACGDSPFLEDDLKDDSTRTISPLEVGLVLPDSNLNIMGLWRQGPVVPDESKLLLVLTQNGVPTDPNGELRVKLWMPSMGHGSFPVSVIRTAVGTYEISDLFFTMEGDWDIHFQIFKDDKLQEEVKWPIEL